MRKSRNLIWIAALLVVAAAQAGPDKETETPPQLFRLEVDGKPTPIELDKPLVVKIGDRAVTLKLTARPYRELTAGQVRLRYSRGLAFEYDQEDGVPSWSMDGSEFTIMLHKQAAGESGDLLAELVEGMLEVYDKEKTRLSDARIELDGKKFAGRRIDTVMAGQKLRQEVFVLPHGKANYVLVLLCFPEDGKIPADAVAAFRMLRESFRFLPAEPR